MLRSCAGSSASGQCITTSEFFWKLYKTLLLTGPKGMARETCQGLNVKTTVEINNITEVLK